MKKSVSFTIDIVFVQTKQQHSHLQKLLSA